MGANEFNSESASEQGDGDYRDADRRTEESESLLERVREEQRRFSAAINSLNGAVTEYAQVLNHIRELRVERAKERSVRLEETSERTSKSHQQDDHSHPRVKKHSSPETHHDREGGFSL